MPKRTKGGLPVKVAKKAGLGLSPKLKKPMKGKAKKAPEKVAQEIKPDEVKSVPVSDALPTQIHKGRWRNKQRVLIFSARGITYRDRHLMQDLKNMLPHAKSDSKMDKKDPLFVINEICETRNCNKSLFFECRKKKDLYMWLSQVPVGPSVKFLVENVHTSGELKMAGNCLKGSRPMLSFDSNFDEKPHWMLLKEMFVQTFGTPNNHPKSQPFYDHVYSFTVLDNRIWFRNFQILEEDGQLVEIGPRFVLNPIKIFTGSFHGEVLWENPDYISPNVHRRMIRKAAGMKYRGRIDQKLSLEARQPDGPLMKPDPLADVFDDAPQFDYEATAPAPEPAKKKRKKNKPGKN